MPFTARRILVAGVSGVGKSTLAARASVALDIPYVEMDDLHWGPDWAPRPDFLDEVRALAARDAWITEWQYASARPIVLERAEAIVWLDLPTPVQMARLARRTVSRRVRRTPIWSAGLVEPPLRTALSDPDHILRWGWRTRNKYRRGDTSIAERTRGREDIEIVHLRSARAADRWVAGLARP